MKKPRMTRRPSKKQIGLQLDVSGEKPTLIHLTIKERQCSSKRIVDPDDMTELTPTEYRILKPLVPHKPLYARLVIGIEKDAAGGHCPECEA